MGNCFTNTVPKRVQLSEAHLLGNDVNRNSHKQQQLQHHLSDSEQRDFQYRGFNAETSNDSNLNPVFPSTDSSPKHRPIKSNGMIYGNNDHYHTNLIKLNSDLQRQIDILKQCSNDEIKMLKTRIQSLEKQFHAINDDDCKGSDLYLLNRQCIKGTQTKLCPNVYRIVKISQIYNKLIQSNKNINEFELWNMMNTSNKRKQYDLVSLIEDYTHLLDVHCNNNNIFELKIVYLEIKDILNSNCNDNTCKCIINIKESEFDPNIIYILDIIHCFLYHGYNNNNNNNDRDCIFRQKLRDCIMDKNEEMIEYNKKEVNDSINHSNNASKLSIDIDAINIKRIAKKVYSRTPPIKSPKINIVSIKQRNNSVNSAISNLSRRSISSSKSIHSTPKSSRSSISALSQDNNDNHQDIKLILSPNKNKLTAMEMSEDRIRKLSGQMNEEQIKELINEYDNDQKIVIENEDDDDELINPDENDESSSLNDDERAEIEQFKMDKDKERRGSKHNLMRLQQGNEWDTHTMDQTVQDMKKQLLHLALTTSAIDNHH